MEMEEQYSKSDVHLDLYHLDSEVQKQSGLCQYWNELEAKVKKDKDHAEIRLKVCLGETELALRKDTTIGKQTEASLKAMVEVHPNVIKAREELANAWYEVNMHSAVVKALDHKKKQLENAISLWMRDYFVNPTQDPKSQRISADMRRHMNRNRKNNEDTLDSEPEE